MINVPLFIDSPADHEENELPRSGESDRMGHLRRFDSVGARLEPMSDGQPGGSGGNRSRYLILGSRWNGLAINLFIKE